MCCATCGQSRRRRQASSYKGRHGDTEMSKTVITWNTHKVEGGFRFDVYTIAYQSDSVVLKTGIELTRPRAASKAKYWARLYKARQQNDLARSSGIASATGR
jgi:hypothetical protein